MFFDDFFSSYQLLIDLDEKLMQQMQTRCKTDAKLEIASHDYRSTDKIEIVRWNDNAVETFGSNTYRGNQSKQSNDGSKENAGKTLINHLQLHSVIVV